MNRADIIRMAREAGIDAESDTLCRYEGWVEPLERLATLVAKHTLANIDPRSFMSWQEGYAAGATAEREAIAQMFDDPPPMVPNIQNKRGGCLICGFTPAVAAKAIRARGETK